MAAAERLRGPSGAALLSGAHAALARTHAVINGNGPGGDLHGLLTPLRNDGFVKGFLGSVDMRKWRQEARCLFESSYPSFPLFFPLFPSFSPYMWL